MFERRQAPRLFVGIPATLYTGKAEVRCETHDISRLGVAVMGSFDALPTGRVLRVVLSLTDTSPRVACDCMVAHQCQKDPPLCGLKFVDPPPDLLARLRGRASVARAAAEVPEVPPEDRAQSSPTADEKPAAAETQADKAGNQPPRSTRLLRDERDRELKDLYEEAVKSLK
jgi:hypothetical protein